MYNNAAPQYTMNQPPVVYGQPINSNQMTTNSPNLHDNIVSFCNKYEVNHDYIPSLQKLIAYRSILLCDDSGSMNDLANPNSGLPMTRWEELKKTVEILIEGHSACGTFVDVYFLNRECVRNVTHWSQVAPLFVPPPGGGTNVVELLQKIQQYEVGIDMGKSIIIHFLTDGFPTNFKGGDDTENLIQWVKTRQFKSKTSFSIALCTDDEEVDKRYRRLERLANCDFSQDYRGEMKDIHEARGKGFHFSYGDYVVKLMVGPFDKTLKNIDQTQGCCLIM